MSRPVTIAAVQFQCERARGRVDARQTVLAELDGQIASLAGGGADLVVFSEGVESVGQSMAQAERIEQPGPILGRYAELARRDGCVVAGSAKLREDDAVYNAVVYYGPDGAAVGAYRKSFPTDDELAEGIAPGPGAVVLDTAIGRVGTAICFDLNFESLRREYRGRRLDAIVFASMYHGGLAQAIWAYECRAFLVCAWQHDGGGILDPFGRRVARTDCYHPIARATVNLDRVMVHLDGNAPKLREIERRYGDEVLVDIPPEIGSALVYSRSDRRTAMDLVREFELELLDDYFARSVRLRDAAAGRRGGAGPTG